MHALHFGGVINSIQKWIENSSVQQKIGFKENHVTFDRTISELAVRKPNFLSQTQKLVNPTKNCRFTITATTI
jgi:hypothetical protein